jgi:uncharacterized phage-associated protein
MVELHTQANDHEKETLMSPDILDVASFLIKEHEDMSTMKLQKLCYFSQGWALAWTEEPLFDDDFEAWASGPVSRKLYNEHASHYSVSVVTGGDATTLSENQKLIVKAVLDINYHMSGLQLGELTRMGNPWKVARKGTPEDLPSTEIVTKDSMKNYFDLLATREANKKYKK